MGTAAPILAASSDAKSPPLFGRACQARSKHTKASKESYLIGQKTQHENFRGNLLYQATKRHLNNNSEALRNETKWDTYLLLVELHCFVSGTLENVGMTKSNRRKDTVAKGEDGKCLPQNSKHFFHFFQLDHIHEADGVVENVQLQQASKTEQKKYINQPPSKRLHCSTLSSFKAKLKTFLFSQYFCPS